MSTDTEISDWIRNRQSGVDKQKELQIQIHSELKDLYDKLSINKDIQQKEGLLIIMKAKLTDLESLLLDKRWVLQSTKFEVEELKRQNYNQDY